MRPGRIVGTVTDQRGGSRDSGREGDGEESGHATSSPQEVTASDTDGFFQVLSLPIGAYNVAIEHAGFRKHIQGQNLQINQSLRLDPKLELGQQNEIVEVKRTGRQCRNRESDHRRYRAGESDPASAR